MQYICPLSWPRLTAEQADRLVELFDQNKQYSKKITKSQGQNLAQSEYQENTQGYFNLSAWPEKLTALQNILQWHNINQNNIGQIGIQCSLGELPPHTDFARTVSAICILEGPADTVFYTDGLTNSGARLFDKSRLTEVQRRQLELNTWYLFNNAAIHGVDNYKGRRISLTLDLTSNFGSYDRAYAAQNSIRELFQ